MACFCIKYSFLVFCGHDFKIQRTGQIVLKQTLGSILSEIQYENRIFDTDKMRLPCEREAPNRCVVTFYDIILDFGFSPPHFFMKAKKSQNQV